MVQVVLLFLLFALSVNAVLAQTVPVTGRVMSATNQPVSGAQVSLQPLGGSALTVTSDASGRFQFSGVEPGEYRLTAKAIGLSPVTEVLIVAKGGPELARLRAAWAGARAGKQSRCPIGRITPF